MNIRLTKILKSHSIVRAMDDTKNCGNGSQQPATSNNYQVMEFVNLFGTPKHNKEKARAVRSHVMKLVRKKQSEHLSRAKSLPLLPLSKKIPTTNHSAITRSLSEQASDSESFHNSMQVQPKLSLITNWVESTGVCGSLEEFDSFTGGHSSKSTAYAQNNSTSQKDSEAVNIFPTSFTPNLHELLNFRE